MNSADQIFYQIIDRTHASPSGKENQYSGLCPAHDDQSPSLSITKKPDKVLLYCHAGCSFDELCQSLHLEKSDLFLGCANLSKINENPIKNAAWIKKQINSSIRISQ